MRATLVTHDSIFSRYLAARLHAAGALDRLIVERRAGPAALLLEKARARRPGERRLSILAQPPHPQVGISALADLPMPRHESVTSANRCTFADDELVIGFGTSIISAATLARAPRGILNLHTGWLPDYRGVKSEFWALARGDRGKVGWTLHYMTPRLDDGDIVLRYAVDAHGRDIGRLRAQIMVDAAPKIADFVAGVRRNGFGSISRRAQGDGEYFTTPTLRDWREFKREVERASTERATAPARRRKRVDRNDASANRTATNVTMRHAQR